MARGRARASLRAALTAETAQAAIGFGLAAILLVRFVRSDAVAVGDPGAVLLVVYWSLTLPSLGQELAALVQQYPSQRNVTLRLTEPLGAPEDATEDETAEAAPVADGAAAPAARASATRVELRDVVVQAGGHTILTVDALDIAAGEHVAVVGPSGAGKSSLVGLLLGWHRAGAGAVRVDGAPLAGGALERLRRETVWVDPTVYLWNRSLHDNLAYGLGDAPATLDAALADAELAEVVERLPHGPASLLGEAGALLSGGEGQRVRFGRGVARPRPRLVILDEPFRGLSRDQRRLLLSRARALGRRDVAVRDPRHRGDGRLPACPRRRRRARRRGRGARGARGPRGLPLREPAGRRDTRAPRGLVAHGRRALASPQDVRRTRRRDPGARRVTAPDVRACLWPMSRQDELAHALAGAARVARPAPPRRFQLRHEDLTPEGAASPRVRRMAPAFLHVQGDEADASAPGGLLAVLAWAADHVRVLLPDGVEARLPPAAVAGVVRAAAEKQVAPGLDRVVARAGLSSARASEVRRALIGEALAGTVVAEGWRVRAPVGSFAASLRDAGVARRLALTAVAYGAPLALLVVAWWMVGVRATGRPGAAGLVAWVGVLAAFVAARFVASWSAGRLAIDGGRLLRARLMDGLLALDPEPLRAEGIGQLLGRVMETEAIESLALGGGLLAVAGLFELTTGAVVLALGARGSVELAFLSLALVVGLALARRFWRQLGRWSALRLGLTHDLVERMAGHRTLVAQQPPELRHVGEERALSAYERVGAALDRTAATLAVLVPRGWLLAGVAALAPAFAAGSGVAGSGVAGLVATTLGGVLFVHGALRKLSQAFPSLATAAVAWRQVAPLFPTGASAADIAPPLATVAVPPALDAPALITARALGFRYPGRSRPVLLDCSFEIRRGDRILLEGSSGGGKSTLASLVAGLRAPDAGELALDGVSHATLGLARWRERVGVVPQFHENHVFSNSVLFNLLLGRTWPPRIEDVQAAQAICRDLDLDHVVARMPSGLEQVIGDSGWQLSHGERSRLFIARALLQRLDVRVLDESFAALDPETLERVLACVLARAQTLIVIAHP